MSEPHWYLRLKASTEEAPAGVVRFRRRQRSLFEEHGRETLVHKRIVALETLTAKRIYAIFDSYVKLYHYIQRQPFEQRRLHEVCLGSVTQKPHFDLDIEQEKIRPEDIALLADYPYHREAAPLERLGHLIKDRLLDTIAQVLARDQIVLEPARHFLIFNTHRPDKRSYHILIDRWMHASHLEAGAFYEQVMQADGDLLRRYCDAGIYSENHTLRLLGNHKLGSKVIKRVELDFSYQGQSYSYNPAPGIDVTEEQRQTLIFARSLVCFTSGCQILPVYHLAAKRDYLGGITISSELCQQALNLVAAWEKVNLDDLPYQICGCKPGMIEFKREFPSHCQICQRTHESVGPCIFIKAGCFYYHCRRAGPGNYILLGEIAGIHGDARTAVERFREAGGETRYLKPLDSFPAATLADLGITGKPKRVRPVPVATYIESVDDSGLTSYQHQGLVGEFGWDMEGTVFKAAIPTVKPATPTPPGLPAAAATAATPLPPLKVNRPTTPPEISFSPIDVMESIRGCQAKEAVIPTMPARPVALVSPHLSSEGTPRQPPAVVRTANSKFDPFYNNKPDSVSHRILRG